MIRTLLIASITALLACGPAAAADETRSSKKKSHAAKKKAETGASCKVPAVGQCASCAITCRPGETATCAPGQISGDLCTIQPGCRCSAR